MNFKQGTFAPLLLYVKCRRGACSPLSLSGAPAFDGESHYSLIFEMYFQASHIIFWTVNTTTACTILSKSCLVANALEFKETSAKIFLCEPEGQMRHQRSHIWFTSYNFPISDLTELLLGNVRKRKWMRIMETKWQRLPKCKTD